ncbi:MAG: hypothetical protein HKM02_06435 [Pseudomonadales bacterium]|nr:hypothetical protein [Pseudomonadales bacterium]
MRCYAGLILIGLSVVVQARQYWAREDVAEWVFQGPADHCVMSQTIAGFGSVMFDQNIGHPLVVRINTALDLTEVHVFHMSRESTPWQPASPAVVNEVPVEISGEGHRLEFAAAPAELALDALESTHQLRLTPEVKVLGDRLDVVMQPVRMHDAIRSFRSCRLAQIQKEQEMAAKSRREASIPAKHPQHEAARPVSLRPAPQKEEKNLIHSPYQDWLKQHEAGHHGVPVVTRGHAKEGVPTQMIMHFAVDKSSISKALQDQMEGIVKEWEIRRGEKRSMSLLLEGDASAGHEALVQHRLEAIRGYLLARGMPAARLHVRVRKVVFTHQPDDVDVTVGD